MTFTILMALFTIGALLTVFTYLNNIIQDRRQMRKNRLSVAYKDYVDMTYKYCRHNEVWMVNIDVYSNEGDLRKTISTKRPDIDSLGVINSVKYSRKLDHFISDIRSIANLPSSMSQYVAIRYSSYNGRINHKVMVNNKEIKLDRLIDSNRFERLVKERLIEDGTFINTEIKIKI